MSVAVRDADFSAFSAEWETWLAAITPTLTARKISDGSFTRSRRPEANKPMPPTGPKQWSSKLTPRQRQLLEALPVAPSTEQSVKKAREAAFSLFFAEVPAITKSNGIAWPHELGAAVRTYLIAAGLPLPGAEWQRA